MSRKRVLAFLARGPVRQGALAAAFEVAPRTITELVDGLERDGLVERHNDPKDRRARLVYITAAGRRADEQAMAARAETLGEIFADLAEEEREALSRMLTAVDRRVARMSAQDKEEPAAAGHAAVPLDAPFTVSDERR
ncbi:MarR family transcriptional regulator [Streptomyces cinereospinus]